MSAERSLKHCVSHSDNKLWIQPLNSVYKLWIQPVRANYNPCQSPQIVYIHPLPPPHPVSSAKSVWFEETISNKEVKINFAPLAGTVLTKGNGSLLCFAQFM